MRMTKLTATGLSPAETTWAYSPTKLMRDERRLVSGADDTTLDYTHDAEGVLAGVGPFTYERNGPDKSLSAIADGTGRTEETVDTVADLKTRVLTVGGTREVPARAHDRCDRALPPATRSRATRTTRTPTRTTRSAS